jgi:hypothetical protein
MAKKKGKACWLGQNVRVYEYNPRLKRITDKVLKSFVAGSKGMCENMARWAARNNVEVINLRRDKKSGRLKVML